MVILDLPIPAGFAIEADDLAELVKAGTIAKFQLSARNAIVYLRDLESGRTTDAPLPAPRHHAGEADGPLGARLRVLRPGPGRIEPTVKLTVSAKS